MAATMDTQMPLRDDLNLMGLQELDSHLSIFESSNGGRDSSTPGAMSNSPFGDSINIVEQQHHTIVVESPGENVPYKSPFGPGPRARFTDEKFSNTIPYVLAPSFSRIKFQPSAKTVFRSPQAQDINLLTSELSVIVNPLPMAACISDLKALATRWPHP